MTSPSPIRARYFRAAAAAACSVLLLSACAGSPAPDAQAEAPEASVPGGSSAAGQEFPLKLDNCGTELFLQAPPERVVTIKSTSAELLLALGLGGKIVGTAFSDGPVPEAWAAPAVPVLAEKVPSREAVLGLAPDLVFAGWESNFSADGAGERGQLQELGVQSYVSPAACQEDGYRPSPLTFDDVFASIEEAGDVFGAPDAADELVAAQRAELAAVVPSGKGYSALWYSSGSDTPFVGAGSGAPALLMDSAGLENIAAGIDAGWSPYSWEAVADADPDVIVLVDSAWGSVEKKKAVLEAHPVISQLAAVRERRYLVVPFAASEAGVRNVETVRSLTDQLAALD